jgi:hypothetical protein
LYGSGAKKTVALATVGASAATMRNDARDAVRLIAEPPITMSCQKTLDREGRPSHKRRKWATGIGVD